MIGGADETLGALNGRTLMMCGECRAIYVKSDHHYDSHPAWHDHNNDAISGARED